MLVGAVPPVSERRENWKREYDNESYRKAAT
jgi:hypothetical protein